MMSFCRVSRHLFCVQRSFIKSRIQLTTLNSSASRWISGDEFSSNLPILNDEDVFGNLATAKYDSKSKKVFQKKDNLATEKYDFKSKKELQNKDRRKQRDKINEKNISTESPEHFINSLERRSSHVKKLAIESDTDPDKFGDFDSFQVNLDSAGSVNEEGEEQDRIKDDDFHEKPYIRLSDTGRKHVQNYYERKLKKMTQRGQIQEAIKFFHTVMIEKDRVMPTVFCYSVLIDGLAQIGHTKLAFQLFKKMKEYGLIPNTYIYTELFNACANCKVKEEGVFRLEKLRSTMLEKGIQPHFVTYKAIMKAYGFLGEVRKTFAVMDEAIEAGHKPDADMFSLLLVSCASDKESGFKNAVLVWRHMSRFKITPNSYHYDLMVRITKDCGLGKDLRETQLSLGAGTSSRSTQALGAGKTRKDLLQLDSSEVSDRNDPSDTSWWKYEERKFKNTNTSELATIQNKISILNLEFGNNQIDLTKIKTVIDRFELIGGIDGFLAQMVNDGVKPSIKTLTQMIDLVENSSFGDEKVIKALEDSHLEPDVDFFNLIAKRKVYRNDINAGQELMETLKEYELVPNDKTYGVFALTCVNKEMGLRLIKDMEEADLQPNVEIFGSLIYKSFMDFDYKLLICKKLQESGLRPNKMLISHIEKHIKAAKEYMLRKEKKRGGVHPRVEHPYFEEQLRRFLDFYEPWLHENKVELPEDPFPDLMNFKDESANTSRIG